MGNVWKKYLLHKIAPPWESLGVVKIFPIFLPQFNQHTNGEHNNAAWSPGAMCTKVFITHAICMYAEMLRQLPGNTAKRGNFSNDGIPLCALCAHLQRSGWLRRLEWKGVTNNILREEGKERRSPFACTVGDRFVGTICEHQTSPSTYTYSYTIYIAVNCVYSKFEKG